MFNVFNIAVCINGIDHSGCADTDICNYKTLLRYFILEIYIPNPETLYEQLILVTGTIHLDW